MKARLLLHYLLITCHAYCPTNRHFAILWMQCCLLNPLPTTMGW